ncbi:OmpP1/FadL family transporter [Azoarcus sp. KH32C]|uniref:OmpP1/FadL family transporter n=1 Tax=Azoarcus sp. KH32C TaxID=748247 RepID=UPI00023865F6|nr:porin [Azoarcus sp. KH32C]BAL24181.1 aromatic hydrocarbon degradation protein [Azoarcus sp. KH32C]
MKMTRLAAKRAFAALGTMSVAFPVLATQGTFPHGYGVKAEGMAGVSIALPQDALAGANNPAGMVAVGTRLDLGAALLKVDNGARFGGVDYDGSADRSLYLIPQMGYNHMLRDDTSLGVSVVGNGVGTDYENDANIGGLVGPRSELKQMVITASLAHRLNEMHSVGLGLMLARQKLSIGGPAGLGLPQGTDESMGAGVKLGWIGQLTPALSLGASYSSKIDMGRMKEFDGLLPGKGDLDIPEHYGLGIAYRSGPLTLGADVLRINWRGVDALGNPGVTQAPSGTTPGFGWKDQTVWRVGAAYAVSEALTLRAGYSHGTQILDRRDTFLGVLAPSANRRHYTVGASWAMAKDKELSVAYAKSLKERVNGSGPAPDGITDPYMGQDWLSASLGIRF